MYSSGHWLERKHCTSVSTGRHKEIFLSWCPFVPGTGQEQMSRDKPLCLGTSRDKITFQKKNPKQEKDVLKQEKDVLKQEKDVLKQEKKF
jgi:hypothetical protein